MAIHDKPCHMPARVRRMYNPRFQAEARSALPRRTRSELMLRRLRTLLRTWRSQIQPIQQEEKRAQKRAQKEKRRRRLERLEKQRQARKEARDKRRETRSRACVPRQKARFADLTMDDILGGCRAGKSLMARARIHVQHCPKGPKYLYSRLYIGFL